MWPTNYQPRVPRGAVPLGRFYLTSPPYPVEVTEALLSSGRFERAMFGIGADGYVLTAGMPVSGLMRTLLHVLPGRPIEKLISSGEPTAGLMRTLLRTMDGHTDEMKSSGIPVGGLMRDPLIVYDNWPLRVDQEDLISSGTPVSGVLA